MFWGLGIFTGGVLGSLGKGNFSFLYFSGGSLVHVNRSSITFFQSSSSCSSHVTIVRPKFVPRDHCSSNVVSGVLCDVCPCRSWVWVAWATFMHVLDVVSMWVVTYYRDPYPPVSGLYYYLHSFTFTYDSSRNTYTGINTCKMADNKWLLYTNMIPTSYHHWPWLLPFIYVHLRLTITVITLIQVSFTASHLISFQWTG